MSVYAGFEDCGGFYSGFVDLTGWEFYGRMEVIYKQAWMTINDEVSREVSREVSMRFLERF